MAPPSRPSWPRSGRCGARARELGLPVAALAVGVAAIVDPETGIATGGPTVHWDAFPIVHELGEVVDLPFVVDNDVNLAALAHAWRGDGRGRAGFVVLALGTGIGAAIVADGRLLRGRRSGAGEVGLPRGGSGAAARPAAGRHRCPGGDSPPEPALRRGGGRPRRDRRPCADSPETILRAAAAGDAALAPIARDLVDHVAMTLIAVAATTDPELVVLDGTVGVALAPCA